MASTAQTDGVHTTYIASMGILVMGRCNERVAQVGSLDEAKAALVRLGYRAQIAWSEGLYGAWRTLAARNG